MKSSEILLFITAILSFNCYYSQSLSEQLWERVQPCNVALEDMDEEGKHNYEEIVDDAKNGYLKISGSYPTCGCECSYTVGAYKTAAGKYVLIDKSTWSCGWTNKISSNREIQKILPSNLTESVLGYNAKPSFEKAYFYFDLEIPHHGTETKLAVKIIPFGLKIVTKDQSLFSYEYEESGNVENYAIYNISEIIKKFDQGTINALMNAEYAEISDKDMEILSNYIRKNDYDSGRFASIEEITDLFVQLRDVYEKYQSLKFSKFTLDWNREKEQFYIKSSDSSPKEMSFMEFLEIVPFWMPMC